ncbi:hypothetical protein NM134_0918 [Neisseria meningitidis NM134]|nr:hypothetical protein NM134_1241 [Neisseria meningitidis NM134]EPF55757.1 hypothetical protein NM134_1088 [Neisseria meningitidis NM134]EPF55766.1 hypothetical protein NM134_1070 [Neisseria meningitidis NM134]EPF56174.1 hypothetical protein NM134_0918 [Neisseria meningitidis NM134]
MPSENELCEFRQNVSDDLFYYNLITVFFAPLLFQGLRFTSVDSCKISQSYRPADFDNFNSDAVLIAP